MIIEDEIHCLTGYRVTRGAAKLQVAARLGRSPSCSSPWYSAISHSIRVAFEFIIDPACLTWLLF